MKPASIVSMQTASRLVANRLSSALSGNRADTHGYKQLMMKPNKCVLLLGTFPGSTIFRDFPWINHFLGLSLDQPFSTRKNSSKIMCNGYSSTQYRAMVTAPHSTMVTAPHSTRQWSQLCAVQGNGHSSTQYRAMVTAPHSTRQWSQLCAVQGNGHSSTQYRAMVTAPHSTRQWSQLHTVQGNGHSSTQYKAMVTAPHSTRQWSQLRTAQGNGHSCSTGQWSQLLTVKGTEWWWVMVTTRTFHRKRDTEDKLEALY